MAASACTDGTAPLPSEADLLAANARYDTALIAGDSAALDQLYLPDFTYVGADGEVRNKTEQIRAFASGSIDLLEGRSHDIVVRPIGSARLTIGAFTGRVRVADNEFSFRERYSALWLADDGRWRLAHEHGSVVPDSLP